MKSIGYSGQPTPDLFRRVDPPMNVEVDLIAMFHREPHIHGRYTPLGLQLHKIADGTLAYWGLYEQGRWWGLVTYDVKFGRKKHAVTHWVPAWVIRPAKD